jgi:hypothetical protein
MLLVFPVTKADSELAVKLAKWISVLGGGANHHLVVAATNISKEAGEEVQNILQNSFSSTSIFIPDQEHELGWPSSANFMFQKTLGHLYSKRAKLPMYWFEADNVPLKPSWLDDLLTEYNLAKKPFMGVVEDTCVYDEKTRKLIRKDGKHMNGSGIYHHEFVGWSQLFETIHTHEKAQPWDIYLRWEMNGRIHDSRQMLNNWKSIEYTRTADGQIASKALDPNHPSKYVTDAITVVHGCKDGSLIELLEKERNKPKKTK